MITCETKDLGQSSINQYHGSIISMLQKRIFMLCIMYVKFNSWDVMWLLSPAKIICCHGGISVSKELKKQFNMVVLFVRRKTILIFGIF